MVATHLIRLTDERHIVHIHVRRRAGRGLRAARERLQLAADRSVRAAGQRHLARLTVPRDVKGGLRAGERDRQIAQLEIIVPLDLVGRSRDRRAVHHDPRGRHKRRLGQLGPDRRTVQDILHRRVHAVHIVRERLPDLDIRAEALDAVVPHRLIIAAEVDEFVGILAADARIRQFKRGNRAEMVHAAAGRRADKGRAHIFQLHGVDQRGGKRPLTCQHIGCVAVCNELLRQIGDRVQHAVRAAAVIAQVDDKFGVIARFQLRFHLGGKFVHRMFGVLPAAVVLHIQRTAAKVEQLVVYFPVRLGRRDRGAELACVDISVRIERRVLLRGIDLHIQRGFRAVRGAHHNRQALLPARDHAVVLQNLGDIHHAAELAAQAHLVVIRDHGFERLHQLVHAVPVYRDDLLPDVVLIRLFRAGQHPMSLVPVGRHDDQVVVLHCTADRDHGMRIACERGQLGQLDRKIKVGQPFQPGPDLADLVRNLLLGGIGIKIRVVFGQRLHQIVQILLPRLHGIVRRARQRQSAQHHSRTQASRQPLLHAHVRSPLCIIIITQIYIRAGNLSTPCFLSRSIK